jgi:hypothetical protein
MTGTCIGPCRGRWGRKIEPELTGHSKDIGCGGLARMNWTVLAEWGTGKSWLDRYAGRSGQAGEVKYY